MQHRLLVDVIVRPEYVVRYEQVDDSTFVHVDVHQWGPRIACRFRDDISTAHALLGRPVYAIIRPELPRQPKFLTLHGFKPCGHVNDELGRVVKIYVRTIDGLNVRWWHPEREQH